MKKYIRRCFRALTATCWNIGFINNWHDAFRTGRFETNWLQHDCKDRWFADPFILNVTDTEIILLCEEYLYATKRGRISKLTVDKNDYQLKSVDPVLDLDTHLSFPAIFRTAEGVYIYPENLESGKLALYQYDDKKNTLDTVSLLSNKPLVDAVIVTAFDRPYLFAINRLTPERYKNLEIYTAAQWNGFYEYKESIVFDRNIARGAGNWFQIDGKWIRPAQDCTRVYGGGLIFNEAVYKDGTFSFAELSRWYPSSHIWNTGIHTFNIHENRAVIDGCRYRRPVITAVVSALKTILNVVMKRQHDR